MSSTVKMTIRISKKEAARINTLMVTGGYGSRTAIYHEAVRDLLADRLPEYDAGVEMGGSVHKSTGKAGQ